tara:strand:+ start:2525 stop:3442 length:918 start_codon:yes stop_codon:yes gene_type:complete
MNKIHIITIKDRSELFDQVKEWWEKHNWIVEPIYNDGQLPRVGWNKALRKFYDSNEDWVCIADDDIILLDEDGFKDRLVKMMTPHFNLSDDLGYPDLNYREFLSNNEELFNNEFLPTSFEPIHQMGPDGRFEIIRLLKTLDSDMSTYNDNWVFVRHAKISKIRFHRNTKKMYNKEFFWKTITELTSLSDWDWTFQQLDAGLTTGRLTNIISDEISGAWGTSSKSSLFKNMAERRGHMKVAKRWMSDNYEGMKLNSVGSLCTGKWLSNKWNPPFTPSKFHPHLSSGQIWKTNTNKIDRRPRLLIKG